VARSLRIDFVFLSYEKNDFVFGLSELQQNLRTLGKPGPWLFWRLSGVAESAGVEDAIGTSGSGREAQS